LAETAFVQVSTNISTQREILLRHDKSSTTDDADNRIYDIYGFAAKKTLLQQNPLILDWSCLPANSGWPV